MTIEEANQLKELIDKLTEKKIKVDIVEPAEEEKKEEKRVLPEGKRVVRTKSSGDRVYLLDDTQDPKTRSWVTNPEVLKGLGFEIEDVKEVDDAELLKYAMSAAIYRVENAT